MILLYGKGGFELLAPDLDKGEQETLFYNAVKLLKARCHPSAAGLLQRLPFDCYNATNDFNDDFHVLFAFLPLVEYEEMHKLSQDVEGKIAFQTIATVVDEIGPYIRFIACDLAKEDPDAQWQSTMMRRIQDNEKRNKVTLPVAVCAVVNEILSGSHATLDELFRRAGAPGDPPAFSHATKWKNWLLRAGQDPNTDALQVLGKVLEEFMEVEPAVDQGEIISWLGSDFPSARSLWQAKKQRLENVLRKYGFRYVKGGRIVQTDVAPASEALAQAIREHDFDTIEVEFRRAVDTVNDDPGTAITAGCALLEALYKAFLEEKEIELPAKETIKPLWNLVQKELGLDPKDQTDMDIQRILSGMTSLVDGIGALRTHAGSAHGGGKLRYRMKARHARLLINCAHTLALFLIETWKDRDAKLSENL